MTGFLKKRWPLLAVLIVFCIFKWPHLFYPYYWDESWPYAVAIKEMYMHSISLMPTAIDGELSRGHPLFFHALGAAWMSLFGTSHLAMHSMALTIALLCLIVVYEAGLHFFNQRVAVLATILLAVQTVFFVQASSVLFDLLVGMLAFASIYYYVRDKYVMTMLCLTILFYTKESGLIAGFVIGVDALISFFRKEHTLKVKILRILSVGVPCILIAIFFVIQKHIRGWYILPMYNDLIKHEWASFWYCFKVNSVVSTFVRDNRAWYFVIVLLLAVIATIKTKNYRQLIVFFPAIVLYYCSDDMRSGRIMPGQPFMAVFVLSFIVFLYILNKDSFFRDARQRKFIVLQVAFLYCFLVFSSMNFFTPRYMLATIIPYLFITAAVAEWLSGRISRFVFYPVCAVALAAGIFTIATDNDMGDCGMGAFDGMKTQQDVVDYFEQNNLYDKWIGGLFLNTQHLMNPACGFRHSERAFTHVAWDMNIYTDYLIFDCIERDDRYEHFKSDPAFRLARRFEHGSLWAEIYQRK